MPSAVRIFGGGELGPWALDGIAPGDRLVGADRGALFLVRHGLAPELAIGDFDSVSAAEAELIRMGSGRYVDCDAIDKDMTDLEMALDWALSQQPGEIIVAGATGTRLDHTLANLQLLRKGAEAGIPCRIIDAHNEVRLLMGGSKLALMPTRHTYVSLLPLSPEVRGVTLHGFRYPLTDATLRLGSTLGISNELIGGEAAATIETTSGDLFVISSDDRQAGSAD